MSAHDTDDEQGGFQVGQWVTSSHDDCDAEPGPVRIERIVGGSLQFANGGSCGNPTGHGIRVTEPLTCTHVCDVTKCDGPKHVAHRCDLPQGHSEEHDHPCERGLAPKYQPPQPAPELEEARAHQNCELCRHNTETMQAREDELRAELEETRGALRRQVEATVVAEKRCAELRKLEQAALTWRDALRDGQAQAKWLALVDAIYAIDPTSPPEQAKEGMTEKSRELLNERWSRIFAHLRNVSDEISSLLFMERERVESKCAYIDTTRDRAVAEKTIRWVAAYQHLPDEREKLIEAADRVRDEQPGLLEEILK